MAKSTKKKAKKTISTKKTGKNSGHNARIAENADCLWELHKLQGVLLTQLRKEVH